MIECIIVGDYDENSNKLPRVARFVLKTGKEYKFTISTKNNIKNDKNELVSFDTGNVSFFNRASKDSIIFKRKKFENTLRRIFTSKTKILGVALMESRIFL